MATSNRVYETREAVLPSENQYSVTQRDTKVKNTYMRYDRLLCIAATEGYDGMHLSRVVDVSWYKATSTQYASIKSHGIIYCHVYVKSKGHAWGYCGGAMDNNSKATYAMQDALDKMGVELLDDDGNAGSIAGCGASPVLSAVRAIARAAEPQAIALGVFD